MTRALIAVSGKRCSAQRRMTRCLPRPTWTLRSPLPALRPQLCQRTQPLRLRTWKPTISDRLRFECAIYRLHSESTLCLHASRSRLTHDGKSGKILPAMARPSTRQSLKAYARAARLYTPWPGSTRILHEAHSRRIFESQLVALFFFASANIF